MNYLNNKLTLSSKKIFAYDTFEGMHYSKISLVKRTPSLKKTKILTLILKINQQRYTYKKNEWCYASLNEVQNNLNKFDKNYQNNLVMLKVKLNKLREKRIKKYFAINIFYESTKKGNGSILPQVAKQRSFNY